MNAYTVSRLALDAGVSVHIVRDYLLRGLLRPVACTPGGYGCSMSRLATAVLRAGCLRGGYRPRRAGAAVPGAGCCGR
jgi:mercuric resistance transcriptional repressor protein MerD